MFIDISLLKNIDFTNKDNLLFLSVFVVLAIIFFWIFVVIIKKIIRFIERLIVVTFNMDVRKPKFDKKNSTGWLHQSDRVLVGGAIPKQKIVTSGFSMVLGDEKTDAEKNKNTPKSQKEKEAKDIADSLASLKPEKTPSENDLASKMPSRTEEVKEEDYKGIKIPVPKHFSENEKLVASIAGKNVQDKSTPQVLKSSGEFLVGQAGGVATSVQKIIAKKNEDGSIFEGGSEISRAKLKHELRADAKVWKASRQAGLTLSPVERAKLVKDVFAPVLGRNISKTDLKQSINKLNRKMLGTTNAQEHAKIRKEIKFFKKIGGIKN